MALKLRETKSDGVFGVALEELLKSSGQQPHELPRIAAEIIDYLKRRGIATEKIFVQNGDEVTVQLLKKLYTTQRSVQLAKYSKAVTSIAVVLKTFFIELPEPVLTKRYVATFLKTNSNPDRDTRLKLLRKLVSALPAANKTLLSSQLDLLRLALHHRHKNKLSMMELCSEWGPIVCGLERSSPEVSNSAELTRTLLIQRPFLFGQSEEPSTLEDLPIVTRSSKKKLTKHTRSTPTKKRVQRQRPIARAKAQDAYTSSDEPVTSDTNSELDIAGQDTISLVDAVLNQVLDSSIQNILFEPTVRISYSYETKIPNFIRKLYTSEKLIESALGPAAAAVSPTVVPLDEVKRTARSRSSSNAFGDDADDRRGSNARSPRPFGEDDKLYESPRVITHARRDTDGGEHAIPKTLSAETLGIGDRLTSPLARTRSVEKGLISPRQRLSSDITAERRHFALDASTSPRDELEDEERRRLLKKERRASGGRSKSTKVNVKLDMTKMKGIPNRDSLPPDRKTDRGARTERSARSERGERQRSNSISDSDDEPPISARADKDSSGKRSRSASRSGGPVNVSVSSGITPRSHTKDDARRSSPNRRTQPRNSPSGTPSTNVSQELIRASSDSTSPRNDPSPRAVDLTASSSSGIVLSSSSGALSSSKTIPTDGGEHQKLFAEKKELQIKLNHFQQEFERQHGRKIMYEEDKAPIAAEYARYKQVKQLLSEISPSAQ